jgi:hypothetical protein
MLTARDVRFPIRKCQELYRTADATALSFRSTLVFGKFSHVKAELLHLQGKGLLGLLAGDHTFLRHCKLEFGFDLLGLEIFVENGSQDLGAGTADQAARSAGSQTEKWEGFLEEFLRGKVFYCVSVSECTETVLLFG